MLDAARRYIDDWRRLAADEAGLKEYLAPGVTFHSDGLLYGKVGGDMRGWVGGPGAAGRGGGCCPGEWCLWPSV
jgi:hypothetical protein